MQRLTMPQEGQDQYLESTCAAENNSKVQHQHCRSGTSSASKTRYLLDSFLGSTLQKGMCSLPESLLIANDVMQTKTRTECNVGTRNIDHVIL